MVDPIDWGIVVESPVFWGAVMGLIGILAGNYGSLKSKKEDMRKIGIELLQSIDVKNVKEDKIVQIIIE